MPPRLGKARMAGCVQEARQVAETARQKELQEAASEVNFSDPRFDPDRQSGEVLKAIDLDYDAPGEAKELAVRFRRCRWNRRAVCRLIFMQQC